jgi:hypothetical protein
MFGFGLDNLLKTPKVDTDFKSVQETLGNIAYINAGGCGISALAMYRWLKANNKLQKDTAFMYFDNNDDTYNDNRKALKGQNVEPTSCSHVVLKHGKKYIDCYGEIQVKYRFRYKLRIKSEAFVVASINNLNCWNPSFDRAKNVPKIQERLGIDLSDIRMSDNSFDKL